MLNPRQFNPYRQITPVKCKTFQPIINKDPLTMYFNDVSVVFLLFLYLHICRKVNAEFNKLIKTVGHSARFFEK